jgi:type IV pilus assembly protein PilO
MNLSDLRNVDFKDLPRAPLPVKAVALAILFLAIVGVGYYLDWSGGLDQLASLRNEEQTLRDSYVQKKRQAYNFEAYKQRLSDIEQSLAALLKQLPSKAEMDALLTDINQVGVSRGLSFDLFKPGNEVLSEFYATLPVTIKVGGDYNDIAGFVSDVAHLPRVVTVHNIVLTPAKDGKLTMDAVLHTYRYLEESEIAAQKKASKKKGGR